MGPPGPGSNQYGSQYSMSRTCGPRDITSLFIPRIGDNRPKRGKIFDKVKRGKMNVNKVKVE
jgi:hypothetical protein